MGDVDASSATALRRSKRDSAARALESTTLVEGNASGTAAAANGATRRSQRSAKAPPGKEPAAPDRASTGKKTVKVADADPAESETVGRRVRPTRAAVAEPSTPTVGSPVRGSSPTKKEKLSVVDGESEANGTPALLLTPTRNRRPSRRQVDGDAPTERAQLLLGEFSASEATALCEVVWYHIKENSYKSDVLLRDRSPACIDWHRVAERLGRSHEIKLSPRACQRLWKFLAYAQDTTASGEGDEDVLMADSDPEDYELSADKINALAVERVAHETGTTENFTETVSVAQDPTRDPSTPEESTTAEHTPREPAAQEPDQHVDSTRENGSTTSTTSHDSLQGRQASSEPCEQDTRPTEPIDAADTTGLVAVGSTADPHHDLSSVSHQDTNENVPRETLRTAGVQLYPRYDQPSGVPDDMQKPFDLKHQMPLVFIAEKFLRRKVVPPRDPTTEGQTNSSMEVDPSILAAAAMSVTLTGEKTQSKPKKKRASEAGGEEKKPKKPRKKKEPSNTLATAKVTPGASTAPPLAPTTTKSPVPIRQAYMPSLTAPPTPTPARPALDFFGQLYKENPSILHTNGSAEQKTEATTNAAPSASVSAPVPALDPAQIEAVFMSAPLHVRTACEQMATDDLRRFEREQLRRRLWEKARASLQNSPAPSPAAGSAPAATIPSTPASAPPATVDGPTSASTTSTLVEAEPAAASAPAPSEATLTVSSSTSQNSHKTQAPSTQLP